MWACLNLDQLRSLEMKILGLRGLRKVTGLMFQPDGSPLTLPSLVREVEEMGLSCPVSSWWGSVCSLCCEG